MLPLFGQTVAIAETRQDRVLAGMLERAGAKVWLCPMVAILDAPDQAPVLAWIRALDDGELDDVIFYTGEGVRRLREAAERAGLEREFALGLSRVRRIVRGNKPVRELQAMGLREDFTVEPPTTDGVLAWLDSQNMAGRRVGIQLYGTDPNARLMEALAVRGAHALPVAPYVYASAADEAQVEALIHAMAEEKVDAIVFTSASQWGRLKEVAETRQLAHALRAGMEKACVAAVGPNVLEKLRADHIRVDCMPADETWFMNALVRALGKQ